MNYKLSKEFVIKGDDDVKKIIKDFLFPPFRVYSDSSSPCLPLYMNNSIFNIGEGNSVEEVNTIFDNELLHDTVKKHFSVFIHTNEENSMSEFTLMCDLIQRMVNEKGNIRFFFIVGHFSITEKETPHLHIFYESYSDNENELVKEIVDYLSE